MNPTHQELMEKVDRMRKLAYESGNNEYDTFLEELEEEAYKELTEMLKAIAS